MFVRSVFFRFKTVNVQKLIGPELASWHVIPSFKFKRVRAEPIAVCFGSCQGRVSEFSFLVCGLTVPWIWANRFLCFSRTYSPFR